MKAGIGSLTLLGLLYSLALSAALPPDLQLQPVANGFSSPTAVRSANDGSGRLFVAEQCGTIQIIDSSNTVLPTPFLDVDVTCGGEQGLLGLAFDPNYSTNGTFYVTYTAPNGDPRLGSERDQVLARYSVSSDPNVANALGTVVLRIPDIYSNHNGGDIYFGNDNYLYWAMGDGGAGGDPHNFAQNTGTQIVDGHTYYLLGKMLRLDVRNPTGSAPANQCGATAGQAAEYSIPSANPFIADSNRCAEIWAYGLRNPWRFSFDKLTHDLVIGDVGQGAFEEVDFEEAGSSGGRNYGWSSCEGRHYYALSGSGSDCPAASSTIEPVSEYDQSVNGRCAISGGFIFRGPVQMMQGTYFYGDYCSGEVFYTQPVTGAWDNGSGTAVSTGLNAGNISSFGEDELGNVYITNLGGQVLKFSSDYIFENGFEN